MRTFFQMSVRAEDASGPFGVTLIAYVDSYAEALEAATRWISRHGGHEIDIGGEDTEVLEWEDVPREWLLPDVDDGIIATSVTPPR